MKKRADPGRKNALAKDGFSGSDHIEQGATLNTGWLSVD